MSSSRNRINTFILLFSGGSWEKICKVWKLQSQDLKMILIPAPSITFLPTLNTWGKILYFVFFSHKKLFWTTYQWRHTFCISSLHFVMLLQSSLLQWINLSQHKSDSNLFVIQSNSWRLSKIFNLYAEGNIGNPALPVMPGQGTLSIPGTTQYHWVPEKPVLKQLS